MNNTNFEQELIHRVEIARIAANTADQEAGELTRQAEEATTRARTLHMVWSGLHHAAQALGVLS